MADGPWRAARQAPALLLIALAAGCDDARGGFDPGGQPRVGDVDPKAPPGWPLRIGDPDFVEWAMPGGVDTGYESWLGNCCISVVDGVRYTAKFRIGTRNGKSYNIYEGHVKAEPQWETIGSSFPEFFSPEEWEDIKTYPGWEELIKPRIPASVSKEWRNEHVRVYSRR